MIRIELPDESATLELGARLAARLDRQVWTEVHGDVSVVAPASRHGDDPETSTQDLFEAMEGTDFAPAAIDVVAADTLAILIDAAERSSSVGSRRIAEAIRDAEGGVVVDAVSGELALTGSAVAPVVREYRVVTITDGSDPIVTGTVRADR